MRTQNRLFQHFATKAQIEPNPVIKIFRCARSQHKIRHDRIIFSAAVRRDNQPFMYVVAIKRIRIYRMRTFRTCAAAAIVFKEPDAFSAT